MEIYKDHKIPVIRFFHAFNENDYRALVKDFDVDVIDDDFEYIGDENLEEVFYDIYYKYCELIKDKETLSMLKKKKDLLVMRSEYNVVSSILDIFSETENLDILNVLNQMDNYKIDFSLNLKPQVEKIIRKLKLLKNKINVRSANFDKRYKNKVKDAENKPKLDIHMQCAELELGLELKYSLDPYTTTLVKWCTMINLAQIKSKQYEQNKNNLRRSRKATKRISS